MIPHFAALSLGLLGACSGTPEPVPAEPVVEEARPQDSWPAECDSPKGAVMRLACAGGGRPLIDAFLDQRPSLGAGTATLRGIAEKMPPPAPTARFGDELVAVFAELVPQAAELYLAGKTDAQQAELAAWTLEADPERKKSYELLRSSTGLHFNAAQGLLGMQSMIWGALDPEARHERNNKDLKMSPAESDLGLATRVGDALGSLSVAMTHTDYGAARAALTLTGESL